MKKVLYVLAGLVVLVLGYAGYMTWISNPRVEAELRAHPEGPRARKVMLLTLPGGRTIPVNYLQEGLVVYAGADGSWWEELADGAPVKVFIRGGEFDGVAKAVRDDPAHTEAVFKRLRPDSYKWLGGVLVEIRIGDGGSG